jgi:rhodanese-related sulfurtransferase
MKIPFKQISITFVEVLAVLLLMCSTAAAAGEPPRIQPHELKRMIETKADIVIVDAQVKGAFEKGHIPGAINIPYEENLKNANEFTRKKPVIIYCACGQDEKSTEMANQLMGRFGYTNVKVLAGGWLKWLELGYPQEKAGKKK